MSAVLAPAPYSQHIVEATPLIAAALDGFDETADDVLRACEKQEAFFFAAPSVFVVLKPVLTDMLIWAAGARQKKASAIRRHMPEVEAWARQMGARKCFFRTKRPGFGRILGAGWYVCDLGSHYEWRKRLRHGA